MKKYQIFTYQEDAYKELLRRMLINKNVKEIVFGYSPDMDKHYFVVAEVDNVEGTEVLLAEMENNTLKCNPFKDSVPTEFENALISDFTDYIWYTTLCNEQDRFHVYDGDCKVGFVKVNIDRKHEELIVEFAEVCNPSVAFDGIYAAFSYVDFVTYVPVSKGDHELRHRLHKLGFVLCDATERIHVDTSSTLIYTSSKEGGY